ncbi:MAG: MFS transporter [Chloroflexi bacterium]|nr:MFS transporter [Chloroflexota bacterium]
MTSTPTGSGGAAGEIGAGSGAFGSLRNGNFRLLITGTLASGFANWMESIGQGWLVHQLTHSPFQLGLVQFLRGISILFASPIVGAVAERVDRKKLAGAATAINAANALVIGLLVATGRVEVWHLYVTAFVGGTASSIYNPVRQYLVYSSVGPESLANAIALNAGAMNMSRVVAPNVSGAMIGFFGVQSSFFAEAMFFLAACFTLLQLRLRPVVQRPAESMWHSIRLGVSFLRQHPILSRLVLLQAVPTFLVYPYLQLMPSIAADYLHVGPQGYGFLQTGVGLGSILMTLVVAQFSTVRNKGRIMSVALMMYMAMIFLFSFSRVFLLSFGLLTLGGMNLVVFTTFNQTLLQLNLEDEYRARVLALFTMVQGLNPFGSLIMGAIAERAGTPHAIAMMSGVAIVAALFAGVGTRRVREL